MTKQLTLYYIYSALVGTWFASGIALFFNIKYLSIGQLGVVDALVFAIGLGADIPTGALADRLGRRRIVILGVVLGGTGYTLWGLAVAGWMIVAGNILYVIGTAFQSGADTALMYDYLKGQGREDLWSRVSVTSSAIARLSYVVSIFAGGLAFTYADRLPFLLRAVTFFLMVVPVWNLGHGEADPREASAEDVIGTYWENLADGMGALFTRQSAWIVPIFVLVQGFSYTVFTAGLLRSILYKHAGLAVRYHSAAIAFALVLTTILLLVLKRHASMISAAWTVFGLAALCALGFILDLGPSLLVCLIGLTVLQVATYVLMPVLSAHINRHVASRHRATALSTANVMQTAVYIVAAPVIGFMAGRRLVTQITIGAAALVVTGLLLSALLYVRLARATGQGE